MIFDSTGPALPRVRFDLMEISVCSGVLRVINFITIPPIPWSPQKYLTLSILRYSQLYILPADHPGFPYQQCPSSFTISPHLSSPRSTIQSHFSGSRRFSTKGACQSTISTSWPCLNTTHTVNRGANPDKNKHSSFRKQ